MGPSEFESEGPWAAPHRDTPHMPLVDCLALLQSQVPIVSKA